MPKPFTPEELEGVLARLALTFETSVVAYATPAGTTVVNVKGASYVQLRILRDAINDTISEELFELA